MSSIRQLMDGDFARRIGRTIGERTFLLKRTLAARLNAFPVGSHGMAVLGLAMHTGILCAGEFHVATNGNDHASGTRRNPLRTIQRAADLAQPGDVITVHQGVYRERVNPPRGGESNARRIVYRAAPHEHVEIKGSEVVKNWAQVHGDVWQAVLPNSFFGGFNPYGNLIRGDWFNPKGREHHTGAVYLNGEWLAEAARLENLMQSPTAETSSLNQSDGQYLLNVAWLQPVPRNAASARIPANRFAAQHGIQTAPCSEGGECIGWIEHGDWARYAQVDLGNVADQIEIRAASVTEGGVIEVRLDGPDGKLLGRCTVTNTGDWQAWSTFRANIQRTSGTQDVCLRFQSRADRATNSTTRNVALWFARVDPTNTTLWAQFPGVNPNQQLVEINVRQTVFYPDQPGRNFITVRGFMLRHAATPWAPPTAEQIGLIGTHWSQGWIIESNVISHSICSGIALGKHGDQFDNTSADTAEGYVKTIERAHAFSIPWTRENIGHHLVRNNNISHCEQAGIVGSLGAAFSTVTGNDIHDIHIRRLFTGAEMAGIKFHAAIDTVIRSNHIHRTCRGLWLDWMAQGTRVSGNLFHENASEDLFLEVNHGPFLVDNNIFLSPTSVLDMSEGGAYVHNWFAGRITNRPESDRETPYHRAHSTEVAGLATIRGGDDRFYNNLFVGNGQTPSAAQRGNLQDLRWISSYGLWGYDGRPLPLATGGNLFFHGAEPSAREIAAVVQARDPKVKLAERNGHFYLSFDFGPELQQAGAALVSTERLGRAQVPKLPYENPDGSPLTIATDYFGKQRRPARPMPGPFATQRTGHLTFRVW